MTATLSSSDFLRIVRASSISASALRELAALKEADAPGMRARAALTDEGVTRLAEILERGGKPTIGFFRRHSLPQERSHDATVSTTRGLPA